MSLRGAERRSNLGFDRLEFASGFALNDDLPSFRVIKTDITFENPYGLLIHGMNRVKETH